jgi:hypothetical protein
MINFKKEYSILFGGIVQYPDARTTGGDQNSSARLVHRGEELPRG